MTEVLGEEVTRLRAENNRLTANNERLRLTLEEATGWNWLDDDYTPKMQDCLRILSETTAESLDAIKAEGIREMLDNVKSYGNGYQVYCGPEITKYADTLSPLDK